MHNLKLNSAKNAKGHDILTDLKLESTPINGLTLLLQKYCVMAIRYHNAHHHHI